MTLQKWQQRAAALKTPTQAFIDGEFIDARDGATFATVTPRDGSTLAKVAAGSAADVDRAVGAAQSAFDDGRWSTAAPSVRKRALARLADLLDERVEQIGLVESLDVGKPISDALTVDVPGAANCFRWYAEAIDKRYGEVAPTDADTLATITREPLGVVGAVVPWNYPLIISAWKLAPALACGNSVVLKPAEQSPLSALMLAELAAEAGIPDGVLNVVPGDGPTAGAALGRHTGVDKIAFTGSAEVAKAFLRYAGESNMKRVSLESGGKSAHVVHADVGDIGAAAAAIAGGIFYNAGQTCHAGSRVVVDRRIRDELTEAIVAEASANWLPGDPLDPVTTAGAIVDTTQCAQVLSYLDIGRDEGARVVTGGGRATPVAGGTYVEPTVFDNVTGNMRVAREEIFGPVLTISVFDEPDEAVAAANDTDYGLAAAVWTRDLSRAHRTARALQAGTVWVNTFDTADITAPFGGVKLSGNGRDRSLHALDQYTSLKTTWIGL